MQKLKPYHMENLYTTLSKTCLLYTSGTCCSNERPLSTAKKEAVRWSNKYHDLWYDVKPYLDALHRAPELVCGFLEKILAPMQELTMNVQPVSYTHLDVYKRQR